MVNDYFSQAAIDFLLGNVTSMVFEEFESDMMTKDPAVSMSKMREQAIELCQKRVIADEDEEFIGGWTLLSPHAPGTIKSMPFEEIVLLLTDVALYLCRLDWNLDKVSSFERVDLAHITSIQFGTYITSTISQPQMDEMKNVGVVISYQPGKHDIVRTNTRTLSSMTRSPRRSDRTPGSAATTQPWIVGLLGGKPKAIPVQKIALKALYSQSSIAAAGGRSQLTEIQQVVTICAEIERLALKNQLTSNNEEQKTLIENAEIISLEEAKRSTGLLEHLGHSIKKMVWA
jgi:hypothetical protein